MKSGELFAGVGGLGMAVDEVFGSSPAWFAEFDTAPSKVLAHRFPNVPNHGDVTKIDFATVEPVNILAGGFPCQDVSLAGRRRGMTSTSRSGLWSEFARAIETIRPDWVVIENVRGLLSADAAGNVDPCPWCLGDNGEQHALRALGAVLGDLAELGFDAEWAGLRAAEVGAPHGRFRVFILAWPAADTDSRGRAFSPELDGNPSSDTAYGDTRGQHLARRTGSEVALLPSPRAMDGQQSMTAPANRRHVEAGFGNLPEIVGYYLLPTPRTTDMNGPGAHGQGGADLRTTISELPMSTDWGQYATAVARWAHVIGREAPSPVRNDGKGGKARLNPELPEWMMGWPAGWVTSPAIGLTRAEQLKAAGNGVVPQQAAHALRHLLSRPGVPTLERAA